MWLVFISLVLDPSQQNTCEDIHINIVLYNLHNIYLTIIVIMAMYLVVITSCYTIYSSDFTMYNFTRCMPLRI